MSSILWFMIFLKAKIKECNSSRKTHIFGKENFTKSWNKTVVPPLLWSQSVFRAVHFHWAPPLFEHLRTFQESLHSDWGRRLPVVLHRPLSTHEMSTWWFQFKLETITLYGSCHIKKSCHSMMSPCACITIWEIHRI